ELPSNFHGRRRTGLLRASCTAGGARAFHGRGERMTRCRRNMRGLTFLELALVLSIMLGILFSAGYTYRYLRVSQAVRFAAETAARIASGNDPALLNWQAGSAVRRPLLDVDSSE